MASLDVSDRWAVYRSSRRMRCSPSPSMEEPDHLVSRNPTTATPSGASLVECFATRGAPHVISHQPLLHCEIPHPTSSMDLDIGFDVRNHKTKSHCNPRPSTTLPTQSFTPPLFSAPFRRIINSYGSKRKSKTTPLSLNVDKAAIHPEFAS